MHPYTISTVVLFALLCGSAQAAPRPSTTTPDSALVERAVAPTWQSQLNLDKKTPATPSGFPKVVFYEHFANYKAGSQPSRDKWTFDKGTSYPGGPANWGTGEVETYTDKTENIVITSAGTLQITPLKKTVSGKTQWTSARIETTKKYDFKCPAGGKIRIQASLLLGDNAAAKQLGIWPAFWSLGSAFRGNYKNWPSIGEVDILENVNGAPTAWQTVHCGTAPNGPCKEFTGLGSSSAFTRGKWHLVSVDIDRTNSGGKWQGEKLVWRIDGAVVFTLTGSTVNNQSAWQAVTRDAKFLLLNVAVGGGFPDFAANPKPGTGSTPTAATLGGVKSGLEARYVAIFGSK